MEDFTLTGQIRRVIMDETKFMKHYIGKVTDNKDKSNKGRVKVHIDFLGWDTDDKAPWCWPRQIHGMDVPIIGEWVEVYFMNGDRNRAVYLGQASEILSQLPAGYSAETDRVLFQDPDSGDIIKYDASAKELSATIQGVNLVMKSGEIDLNGDSKFFVTHAELKTALDLFATNGITHTHNVTAVGSPTGPAIGFPTFDIAAAKTTTIKTGG